MKGSVRRYALVYAGLIAALAAGPASADFPLAKDIAPLVGEQLPTAPGEPELTPTADFIVAETQDQGFGVVRFDYGYHTEVYPVLIAREGDGWRVCAVETPILFMPDIGGDNGTAFKEQIDGRTYYAFTCTEASYGSGMGTEYDYYILYRIDGESLVPSFEGETRTYEDYYSRWYGGEDSSAWEYGGSLYSTTEYSFEDVNGDGASEIWALTREASGEDDPSPYFRAELFAPNEKGDYSEAELEEYEDALAAAASFPAKILLARAALDAGDAAAARAYLEEAAALNAEAAPGIADKLTLLDRLDNDPPEALRLYYAGDSANYRRLIDEYPETAAAAEAVLSVGDFGELLAFLREHGDHPRWPEAYAYTVREALYGYNFEYQDSPARDELKYLKKQLGRYLKAVADEEERAGTLTHLADCFYHAGEYKTAVELFEDALAAMPEGVFAEYDLLRLGDCAAARGDHGAAIEYYFRCEKLGASWWSGEALDALAAYAAVREGAGWRHFLDHLEERGGYGYLTYATGDLDGTPGDDLAVIVHRGEDPKELYYFLRNGDEFRGEYVTTGRPSLWRPRIIAAPDASPGFLSCYETTDGEAGRVTHNVLYRYDGSALREVGRFMTEETKIEQPDYGYSADAALDPGPPPAVRHSGWVTVEEEDSAFREEYVWDEGAFAFVPVE
jgi:hypothetical protein